MFVELSAWLPPFTKRRFKRLYGLSDFARNLFGQNYVDAFYPLSDSLMKLKLLFSFLSLSFFYAHASEITPFINQEGGVNLAISGPIIDGDGIVLSRIVKEITDMALPIHYVSLDIKGGSLEDAVKLSYAIRSVRANTFVANGSSCLNECLIVFSAGYHRVLASGSRVSTKGYDFSQPLYEEDNERFNPRALLAFYDVPDPIIQRLLTPLGRKVYRFSKQDRQLFNTASEHNTPNLSLFTPFTQEGHTTGYQLYLNGLSYYTGIGVDKDLDQAFYFFRLAAEKGDPQAIHRLGVMYYNGLGVPEPSKEWAEHYWRQSASAQYYPSIMNVAIVFESADDIETAAMYSKILNNTQIDTDHYNRGFAGYSLGNYYLYESGRYEKDAHTQALDAYHKGAIFGNSSAQYEYATMLGRIGKRQEAYYWLKLACSAEQDSACRVLKKMNE